MEATPVVTCFLRHDGALLLGERSGAVGAYAGRWGGVSGHADGDPATAARRVIREKTGLEPATALTHVRTGDAVDVTDEDLGVRWIVHPMLFDADRRAITPTAEIAAWEWVPPPAIPRRETVPELWTAYDRVRPTIETVANDTDHGAAWLSLRALEVLRDEAARLAPGDGRAAGWRRVRSVAADLRAARPSMAVVRNRVNRAVADASPTASAAALEAAATSVIERGVAADRQAAAGAAERVAGRRVATLSRSGTVGQALRTGDPAAVLVAESRPGRDGVEAAEALCGAGLDVTLTSDAGFPFELSRWGADVLLVGADAILPDGSVVNKVGTRGAALSAASAGATVVVAAATDKIDPTVTAAGGVALEPRDPAEVYEGGAAISVANVTFDVTPAAAVDTIVTERGGLRPGDIEPIAEELRALAHGRE